MENRLNELLPGEEARIVRIEGKPQDSRRLREMGIRKGGKVLMRRDAPLGDPMEIGVMDSNVSIRKSEAEKVVIEKIAKLPETAKKARIALVGNPNCGKTTLFNLLTGSHQHVGNWPGVTVEKKVGHFSYGGREIELIDLPGTYSMSPNSIEEKIVRNHILLEKPDLVLNVLDGTTLERSLYLTTQLIDTEARFLVAVNMMDEVREKNIEIDLEKLGVLLKTRVVAIAAKKEEGVVPLIKALISELDRQTETIARVNYGTDIEQAVCEISSAFPCEDAAFPAVPLRWAALNLLQEEKEGQELVRYSFGKTESWLPAVEKQLKKLSAIYPDDIGSVMEDQRFGFVQGAIRESVRTGRKKPQRNGKELTEFLDSILLNRFVSFPLFALILWATFQLTFTLGGFFSGFIGSGIQALNSAVHGWMPDGILKDLLTEGIITGVGGILVFFPQIMILFFIIALLEDSGYMARIAFIMDRMMHLLGIHGKSFISMFMGIGCNVPGILAARTLENEEDRIVTVLVNPFMSCSARLPIYVLITGIFFQRSAGTVIFLLYMTGIAVAVLTAKLLKTFFFRGKSVPFVMELPPYRTPSGRSLLIHMWERASLFLRKMGSVILVGSILIWALGYFPRTTSFSERTISIEKQISQANDPVQKEQLKKNWENRRALEQIENSYIGRLGKLIEPFFQPLGFGWREGVALLTGVVGKEVVVSTLSVLYGGNKDDYTRLKSNMTGEGITPASALGFLVFVLLYIPCLAAIAAVRKETHSVKWMLFSIFYGIGIGYLIGFAVNQGGRLLFH